MLVLLQTTHVLWVYNVYNSWVVLSENHATNNREYSRVHRFPALLTSPPPSTWKSKLLWFATRNSLSDAGLQKMCIFFISNHLSFAVLDKLHWGRLEFSARAIPAFSTILPYTISQVDWDGRSLLQPGRILLNWYHEDLWNCPTFHFCRFFNANSFYLSLYVFSSKINVYCGFCSIRILHYFPMCVSHRRDISSFLDNLIV